MAPFLPIQALNRSNKIRINGQTILPGVTTWIDLGAAGVRKDFASHSSIGQVFPVGPLTYRTGGGGVLSSALLTTPAAITTAETQVINLQIPASYLAVGSVLDIEAMGTVSAASAGTITANTRFGTTGTNTDALLASSQGTGITTSTGWRLDVEAEVRTLGTGTAATIAGNARITVGNSVAHGTAVSLSFDSTVLEYVDLSFIGGGTTPSIVVQNANIKIWQ